MSTIALTAGAVIEQVQHLAAVAPQVTVPNPGAGSQPPGFSHFTTVMGWGKWIALGIFVLALIGGGVMMAVSGRRQGDGGEHVSKLGWILGGVMVSSAAVSLVGFLG
ncbi:hypothetical protein ATK17_3922 [Branchiibius hedensis]|uniref:TrbC/VIRB2 family protein n=1 Tax=Branchiibius hedensis TaxID=672460 RepID=A0A2Y9BLU1_9MICO|nr:hypothetical protein [Branchiibius hedensis]PWJ23031.1 hypothetical protein ATK17_3922 [Branchiibius hedensis]SSA59107.1 hypothetical protein SAMN04489750_3922 [Branchiibius hedensis]